MGKSKFHVFAGNFNNFNKSNKQYQVTYLTLQLYYKIILFFGVGKFSIEFEEDTTYVIESAAYLRCRLWLN